MLIKVALVQHEVGAPVGVDLKLHLFRLRPDCICFPEYWGASAAVADQIALARFAPAQKAAMARLSAELDCLVIGGTVVDSNAALRNVSPVYHRGGALGEYAKRHPTARERQRGIEAGTAFPVWDLHFARVAVAICADCLEPDTFDRCAAERVDLLFVPNASPYRPDEPARAKFDRDESIFVAGARRAGSYVIKVCGTGRLFGGRLQGRSLIAAPWGIHNRVPPDAEARAQVITAVLSIEELREFRSRYGSSSGTDR